MSEAAFRETLKGILEKDFKAKVEDREGFVFGYPSIVVIDLVIKDGKVIIVGVKSHMGEWLYFTERQSSTKRLLEKSQMK